MNISELGIGDKLCRSISELIKNDRIPHAVLLDSGSSEARKNTAVYLAEALVCRSEVKPCGTCPDCRKAANGVHPDIIITDPESEGEKTFKVSAVREIRNDAYIIPNEAARKVYILMNADKMNPQAQNALLTIIEEPPSYARFILVCDSRASMLPTIISRVSCFGLGSAETESASETDALADSLASKLAQALTDSTEIGFMKLSAAFEKDKELFVPVLTKMNLIFRDSVFIKSGNGGTLTAHKEIAEKLSSKFTLKVLLQLVKLTEDFIESSKANANKNLLITRFCSVMRNTAYSL